MSRWNCLSPAKAPPAVGRQERVCGSVGSELCGAPTTSISIPLLPWVVPVPSQLPRLRSPRLQALVTRRGPVSFAGTGQWPSQSTRDQADRVQDRQVMTLSCPTRTQGWRPQFCFPRPKQESPRKTQQTGHISKSPLSPEPALPPPYLPRPSQEL